MKINRPLKKSILVADVWQLSDGSRGGGLFFSCLLMEIRRYFNLMDIN